MTWFLLFAGILFAITCLIVPGYLFARALCLQRELSFAVSPLISIAVYCVLAVVYGFVGVPCGWFTLPALLTAVSLVAFMAFGKGRQQSIGFEISASAPLAEKGLLSHVSSVQLGMVLGVLVATVTSVVVYVSSLGSPDSFIQYYDNSFHLSRVHEFAQTGNYSSLSSVFYPSAWHLVAALAESTVGITSPVAQHVANLAFIVAVYPLGMVALMGVLFPDKPRLIWLSGLFCLAIAFWPWRIMLFGPLYPNLASLCMMPAECAIFISLFKPLMGEDRKPKILLFVAGGMALGFAQPNGIFSAGVFLIPFCLYRTRRLAKEMLGGGKRATLLSVLVELGVALLFAAIWFGLTQVPALHDTVYYNRPKAMRLTEALYWCFDFSYVMFRPQFVMELSVIFGALAFLVDPQRRWMVASFFAASCIFIVAAAVGAEWKYLISGFWYSDYYRIAAMASIFAVPLVCSGMSVVVDVSKWFVCFIGEKVRVASGAGRVASAFSAAAIAVLCIFNYVAFDYIDWYWRSYGFDAVKCEFVDAYQNDASHILDSSERNFLKQVKTIVGDSTVANICYDGSGFAYATDDINVLSNLFGMELSDDGELVKRRLNRYVEMPEVKAAAERLNVKYVLQLDCGAINGSFSFGGTYNTMTYTKSEWVGISLVDEDTPGFELVLSEGDMRLYRLTTGM